MSRWVLAGSEPNLRLLLIARGGVTRTITVLRTEPWSPRSAVLGRLEVRRRNEVLAARARRREMDAAVDAARTASGPLVPTAASIKVSAKPPGATLAEALGIEVAPDAPGGHPVIGGVGGAARAVGKARRLRARIDNDLEPLNGDD